MTFTSGNPGKHIKTVDIPEPVQHPSWPQPVPDTIPTTPQEAPATPQRELEPSR